MMSDDSGAPKPAASPPPRTPRAPYRRWSERTRWKEDLRIAMTALALGATAIYLGTFGADSSAQAADRVLSSLLSSVLAVTATVAMWNFERDPLLVSIRFGGSRRRVLGQAWGVRAALVTGLMIVLCVAGLGWTRTPSDPLLLTDITRSVPVAVAASVSWLALATGARVWAGRIGLLLVVFVGFFVPKVGSVAAVLLPGGHVNHLLGVSEPLPFAPWISMVVLWGMASLFALVALVRIPD